MAIVNTSKPDLDVVTVLKGRCGFVSSKVIIGKSLQDGSHVYRKEIEPFPITR
jgi:hypothetical protein